ncbi:MAG: glycoside hydrolase family 19 protein [Henriciella sp.]
MAYYEVVASSGLKIRERPSSYAGVLEAMPLGMRVRSVDEKLWAGNWYRILAEFTDGHAVEGYSHSRYLRRLDEAPSEEVAHDPVHANVANERAAPPLVKKLYRVNATSLRLRDEPSSTGKILVNMPDGTVVEKISDAGALDWAELKVTIGPDEFRGYAHKDYLAPLEQKPASYKDFWRLADVAHTIQDVKRFVGDYAESLDANILGELKNVLTKYGILASPRRFSHFVAQIAHESGKFRILEERMNYSPERLVQVFPHRFPNVEAAAPYARNPQAYANHVYANRMGNGNEASGDGYRYRGRGFIQLTGRENYRKVGLIIGKDIESDPDIVATDPIVALDVAGAYWQMKDINKAADDDDLERVTKLINGGYIGLDDRRRLLAQAKGIWGDAGLS